MSVSSSADVGLAGPSWADRAAAYVAWRPEWPLALITAAAWAGLVAAAAGPEVSASAGHLHAGHAATAAAPSLGPSPIDSLGHWSLMCVAMMMPLALPAARHVAANSFARRRHRATAVFAAAYLLPWLVLGALVLPLARPGLLAPGLAVAAGWQLTPWKRRAVLSCSRTVPLPPFGLRADRACAVFGLRQSLRCLASGWPLMAAMVVLPHGGPGLAAMALATVAMLAEMRARQRRRLIPWLALPMAVAAGLVPVLG